MSLLKGLVLSFQLYSRLPIPIEIDFNKENLQKAIYFMPLVGGVIGLITAFLVSLIQEFSTGLAAALGLFAYIFLSGGMHLDGLADMADGFLSNTSREKTVAIMQDSSLGLYGVLALVLYALIKYSIFSGLGAGQLGIIVIANILSRSFAILIIAKGPLGPTGGFGGKMKEALANEKIPILYVLIITLIIIFIDIRFLLLTLILIIFSKFIIKESIKKIGGLTGDIYGGAIEVMECISLIVLFVLTK